jgi:adenylate cyclase
VTLAEAAERMDITPATLRRWIRDGLIPQYEGEWTPAAIGQARVVAKMRDRGHSLQEIRKASEEGRLAFGFLDELLGSEPQRYSLKDAARHTGLEMELITRLIAGLGANAQNADAISEDELQLLRYVAAVLEAGFPLVALLQLVRVYGQAIARIADAEVRLFHLYVHEPLMRSGATGVETAEQMQSMSRQVSRWPGPSWTRFTSTGCSSSSSRTSSGTWSQTSTAPPWTWGACGWRSPSPTSPATRA